MRVALARQAERFNVWRRGAWTVLKVYSGAAFYDTDVMIKHRLCRISLAALTMIACPGQAAFADVPTSARPLENPANWITSADYPVRALRMRIEGVVGFLIAIDRLGMPSSCDITQSSNAPELDAQTCTLLLQRARFSPAHDANGKSVASSYRSRVRWHIPQTHTEDIWRALKTRETWMPPAPWEPADTRTPTP